MRLRKQQFLNNTKKKNKIYTKNLNFLQLLSLKKKLNLQNKIKFYLVFRIKVLNLRAFPKICTSMVLIYIKEQ